MPGPQTQHKGTVYGDDENAPKPGLGPPMRRRPQRAHRRTCIRRHPRGDGPRPQDGRGGVRMRGAPFMSAQQLLTYLLGASVKDGGPLDFSVASAAVLVDVVAAPLRAAAASTHGHE